MSEHKRRMNPWVPAVILGVVAMLFSVYAIQSQTEAVDAQKKVEQLEQQLILCQKTAEEQAQHAQAAQVMAQAAAAEARRAEEDCQKLLKKKR